MDHQKIHREEHKRMRENKETSFVFLVEEEKLAEALRAKELLEAEARRAEEDEMCEVTLRVHHLTESTVMRILWADTGITHASVEGSDADDYRQVLIRAETIESYLRCECRCRGHRWTHCRGVYRERVFRHEMTVWWWYSRCRMSYA